MLLGLIPLDTDLIGHGGRDDIQVLASESSLGDSYGIPNLGTAYLSQKKAFALNKKSSKALRKQSII